MVILADMTLSESWTLPEVPPAPIDPPAALTDPAFPETDDSVWTKMRGQRLVDREQVPQAFRVIDYVTGGRRRNLDSLPWESRATAFPWWQRPDPYWETTLFGAKRPWRRPTTGTGEATGKEVPYPVTDSGHAERDPTIALDEVPINEYAHLVGLLRLVGVASSEQAAAITGDKNARAKLRKLGFAGVTECSWSHAPEMSFPRVELWRIRAGARYAAYASQIISAATWQERIFCGLSPFSSLPGVLHTRHQSLALEAMLRPLELGGPWLGWLPEAVCVPDRFLPPGHPHLPAERAAAAVMLRQRKKARPRLMRGLSPDEEIDHVSVRADGALVRLDGQKVFIELQAQPAPESVLRKVANWSRLLETAPFGGVVLFVAAPKPAALASVVDEIKRTIANEASPKAWPSLLVASWEEWSPDHSELTDDCKNLRAARFVDNEWQEACAATVPIEQSIPDWELIGRLPQLGITPPWLAA